MEPQEREPESTMESQEREPKGARESQEREPDRTPGFGRRERRKGAWVEHMITVREMRLSDLDQVSEIESRTFSEPWSRNGFETSLQSTDTLYLTALKGERVAGYCGLLRSFEEADITNVAVAEEFRNQGIGRNMLLVLMEKGRQAGILRFTLEVRVSNRQAIHLYETLGFASAGIRKHFYRKPEEDALIMWSGAQAD